MPYFHRDGCGCSECNDYRDRCELNPYDEHNYRPTMMTHSEFMQRLEKLFPSPPPSNRYCYPTRDVQPQRLSDEEILAAVERATQKREQQKLQQRQRAEEERRRKFNAFYDCKIISHDPTVWTPSCPEDVGEIKLFPVGKNFPVDETHNGFLYVKSERVIAEIKRRGLQLLNGDTCSFLREHQNRIPKQWRKFRRIIFLGTVFENWIKIDSGGTSITIPAVRCLEPPIEIIGRKDWKEDYCELSAPFLRSDERMGGDAIAVKRV